MVTTIGAKQPTLMSNRPVVVGLGAIQQKGNYNELDEALFLMDKSFKKAIIDCTNSNITEYIDEVKFQKDFGDIEILVSGLRQQQCQIC